MSNEYLAAPTGGRNILAHNFSAQMRLCLATNQALTQILANINPELRSLAEYWLEIVGLELLSGIKSIPYTLSECLFTIVRIVTATCLSHPLSVFSWPITNNVSSRRALHPIPSPIHSTSNALQLKEGPCSAQTRRYHP